MHLIPFNFRKIRNVTFILALLIILLVLTNPVTAICEPDTITAIVGESDVTLQGYANCPGNVWFELGAMPGQLFYQSPEINVSVAGNYSATLSSVPLVGTFYYKACSDTGNGNQLSFIFAQPTPLVTTNYTDLYRDFEKAGWNLTAWPGLIFRPYTDPMGDYFWGLFFGMIFIGMWWRMEDITIPSFVGIALGASLLPFIPPEWTKFAYSLLIISLAGVIYSLFRKQ